MCRRAAAASSERAPAPISTACIVKPQSPAEGPPHRASPAPGLAAQQTVLAVAVSGVLLASLGGWLWHNATAQVYAELAATSSIAARGLADHADGAYLVELTALYPEGGHVWSWSAHGTALHTAHQDFVRVAQTHGAEWVRLLVPVGEAGPGVPVTEPPPRFVGTVSSDATPRWMQAVRMSDALREAWESGSGTRRFDEADGIARVVVWEPLRNERGHPIAMLEVWTRADGALTAARREAGAVLAAVALLLTGLVVGLRRSTGRLDRERTQVLHALRRFGLGEYDEAVAPTGEISAEVERLRAALCAEQTAAAAVLADAQAALRAAELASTPGTAERRWGIARCMGDHQLLVEVGDVVREETVVVDLTYGLVLLRVGTFTALDLAPGMPVKVGWSRVEPEPELRLLHVRSRTDTDEGVEYLLTGDPSLELPGTPIALRALAYPRRSERIPLAGSGATAMLQLEPGVALPVWLVDASAEGLVLLVARPVEVVAALGTHLHLELSLPGEANVVHISGIVRRVQPCPEGTAVTLEFRVDGAKARDACGRLAEWLSRRARSGLGAAPR